MAIERDLLQALSRTVRNRRQREAITRELRSHLEETRRELELAGLSAAEAERESRARLGSAELIASDFGPVYRPSRRFQLGLACGLAGALILGMFGVSGSLASATTTRKAVPSHLHRHPHQRHLHRG